MIIPSDGFSDGGAKYTDEEMKQMWKEGFERNTKGIDAISTGFSPVCEECREAHGICCRYKAEAMYEVGDIVDEPHFSWNACDFCDSGLGGDREAAHGWIGDKLVHFNICTDCVVYINNGELPDWR